MQNICVAKDLNAKVKRTREPTRARPFRWLPGRGETRAPVCVYPNPHGTDRAGAWARVPQRNSNQQRGWLSRKKKE